MEALSMGTVSSHGNRQTVSSKLQWVVSKYKTRKTNQRIGTRKTEYITVHLETKHLPLVRFFTNKTLTYKCTYEGWNFNSGNYLFTTDTK